MTDAVCKHSRDPRTCIDCASDELARAQRHLDILEQTALQRVSDAPSLIFSPVSPLPADEPLTVASGSSGVFRFFPQRSIEGPFLICLTPYEKLIVEQIVIANDPLTLAPGGIPAVDFIARPWEERPELRFFRIHADSVWRCGTTGHLTVVNHGPTRNFHATIYGKIWRDPEHRSHGFDLRGKR